MTTPKFGCVPHHPTLLLNNHHYSAMMEEQMETMSLEDEEYDKAEGLPSLSDPFMQKYLDGRDALVAQEKKQRSGQ